MADECFHKYDKQVFYAETGDIVAVVICLPVEFIPSKNYHCVMKDNNDMYHYFNKDGSYDGYSFNEK